VSSSKLSYVGSNCIPGAGLRISENQHSELAPVNGEEFHPAHAKHWIMLIVFVLMIPSGAFIANSWWSQRADLWYTFTRP
jgi:hypothetical protein